MSYKRHHVIMKISTRFVKPMLVLRRTAKIIIGVVLFASCKNNEPAFVIRGDKMLTKDLKVNVEALKHDSSIITTTFYKGKRYEIPNQGTLRYAIYVSYKDSLFYKCEFDNLHGEMKGEPINEITIEKKDEAIVGSYRPLKESAANNGNILRPWNIFITDVTHAVNEKEKFTAFYDAK